MTPSPMRRIRLARPSISASGYLFASITLSRKWVHRCTTVRSRSQSTSPPPPPPPPPHHPTLPPPTLPTPERSKRWPPPAVAASPPPRGGAGLVGVARTGECTRGAPG